MPNEPQKSNAAALVEDLLKAAVLGVSFGVWAIILIGTVEDSRAAKASDQRVASIETIIESN